MTGKDLLPIVRWMHADLLDIVSKAAVLVNRVKLIEDVLERENGSPENEASEGAGIRPNPVIARENGGNVGVLRYKQGVQFTTIAPGGFRILAALDKLAAQQPQNITITSACDGLHSGPTDPHHEGRAYDVRTHDQPDPHDLLVRVQTELGTDKFFAWIENAGQENEHLHVQVRHGVDIE